MPSRNTGLRGEYGDYTCACTHTRHDCQSNAIREAAYIMLRYFHELDSSALEPPFHLPSEPMTVIELGAGMGATGFMLAERLLHIGRRDDRIILTDLTIGLTPPLVQIIICE